MFLHKLISARFFRMFLSACSLFSWETSSNLAARGFQGFRQRGRALVTDVIGIQVQLREHRLHLQGFVSAVLTSKASESISLTNTSLQVCKIETNLFLLFAGIQGSVLPHLNEYFSSLQNHSSS